MADTIVDKLVVSLGFKVDDASVKDAKAKFNAVTDAVAGFATGMGALLSAAAGFTFVVAEQNAAIQDQAKALNLTTEAYTELSYAAELSGLTTEGLRMGLMTLQRQLGQAAGGSKEAGALFDSLGVSITDTEGRLRTSAEVLPEIADGLLSLDSDGERAAIQMRLLGEQGTRFNDLFSKGASGLAKLTAEAREFGATLDSDVAERSAQLDDSLLRLRKVTGGLAKSFADDLIPTLQPLVEQLTAFLGASDGIVRSGVDMAARGMALAFRFLATDAGKAAAAVGALAVGLSTARAANGVVGLLGAAGPVGAALASMTSGMAAFAVPAAIVALAIGGIALVLEDFYVTAEGGDSVTRRLADSMGIGAETVRLFAAGFRVLKNSFEATSHAFEGGLLLIGDFITMVGTEVPKAVNAATRAIEQLARAIGIDIDLGGIRDQVADAALNYRKFTVGGAAGLLEGFAGMQDEALAQGRGEAPFQRQGAGERFATDALGLGFFTRSVERNADRNYAVNVAMNISRGANVEDIVAEGAKGIRKAVQATEEGR